MADTTNNIVVHIPSGMSKYQRDMLATSPSMFPSTLTQGCRDALCSSQPTCEGCMFWAQTSPFITQNSHGEHDTHFDAELEPGMITYQWRALSETSLEFYVGKEAVLEQYRETAYFIRAFVEAGAHIVISRQQHSNILSWMTPGYALDYLDDVIDDLNMRLAVQESSDE